MAVTSDSDARFDVDPDGLPAEDRILAYCGLECTECPAYIATQIEDAELLRQTAERWSSPGHRVQPKDILCDGCLGTGVRMTTFCSVCRVRNCARERNLENCGFCPDYACDKLKEHWRFTKAEDEARPVLDEIAGRI